MKHNVFEQKNEKEIRILGYEDSKHWRLLLGAYAQKIGWYYEGHEGWAEFNEAWHRKGPWDLVMLDVNVPTLTGDQLGAIVKRYVINTPIIFFSSEPIAKLEQLVERTGVTGYLQKPNKDQLSEFYQKQVGKFLGNGYQK